MVNVEADALAGPILARMARQAGIVYSLAYGDQPALICEQVDWARAAGFEVVAAGKGTKYLPAYHASTPETVWGHYGFTPEMVAKGDFNAQMFNSFLDGTKSAIEMAAVANATGLRAAPGGLEFPPCGVDDLARVLRPKADGGHLHHRGQVEVISSVERDGRPVFRDLRWGVYVTFAAGHEYVRRCFQEYGIVTDPSGEYASMYKPMPPDRAGAGHQRGERGRARRGDGRGHGLPRRLRGHRQARPQGGRDARRRGRLHGVRQAHAGSDSLKAGGLPIGLAHKVKLVKDVAAGRPVSWADVAIDETSEAVQHPPGNGTRRRRRMKKATKLVHGGRKARAPAGDREPARGARLHRALREPRRSSPRRRSSSRRASRSPPTASSTCRSATPSRNSSASWKAGTAR